MACVTRFSIYNFDIRVRELFHWPRENIHQQKSKYYQNLQHERNSIFHFYFWTGNMQMKSRYFILICDFFISSTNNLWVSCAQLKWAKGTIPDHFKFSTIVKNHDLECMQHETYTSDLIFLLVSFFKDFGWFVERSMAVD